jgi:hypothetical protein
MTPKEKAINLVNNYLCIDEIYNVDLFCDECGISNDAAKYCALIAVDEILSNKELLNHLDYEWWNEVKHEIKKL